MSILSRVLPKQGIPVDDILREFSKEEAEGIYPALSPQILIPLVEELELVDYMEVKDGKAFVTKKGETKLNDFKTSLTKKERQALKM